jgi:CubicO group peptidase (beta-lactamase class C family)
VHFKHSRVLLVWMWLGIAVEAALAQGLAPARPEEVDLSPERLKRLTGAFRGYVENGKLAGAVVLIARRGKVAYLQSFGWSDKESQASMREDAIFRIASQTKPIVSVAVMMLQEQGVMLI